MANHSPCDSDPLITWSDDGRHWHACTAGGAADSHVSPKEKCPAKWPKHPFQANWGGDPCLAAPPTGRGIVVGGNMAKSINPSAKSADMIVAPVSLDGGRTFAFTEWVNDSLWNPGESSGDTPDIDQPHLAADPRALEPIVWFAWRQRDQLANTIAVRGGTVIPKTKKIQWFRDGMKIPSNLNFQGFSGLDGVGGLYILPLGNIVTVIYSDSGKHYRVCRDDPQSAYPATIGIRSVSSFDGGKTWRDSKPVLTSNQFSRCAIGFHYENSARSYFGCARDNLGRLWVAMNDTPGSLQVLMSEDEGSSWTSVITLGGPNPEFIAYGGFYQPTMAADGHGHVGLAFYVGDGPSSAAYFFSVRRPTFDPLDPAGWTYPRKIGNSFNTGTPQAQAVNGARWLGDYNSMAAVPPGSFGEPRAQFLLAWVERSTDSPDCCSGGPPMCNGNPPGVSHLFAALVPV